MNTILRMPLIEAQDKAARLVEKLRPLCAQIQIAGSIRRQCKTCGDIDLVLEPQPGHKQDILQLCKSWHPQVLEDGQINFLFVLKQIHIDLFFADESESDLFKTPRPSNFGTLFVCRTGSKAFNIWLAARAQTMDLHWNPYRGVIKDGEVIASATEAEVFRALNVDAAKYPPEKR